jgi:hypothetical protein
MPIGVYPRSRTANERFDSMVDRTGECHLWTRAIKPDGYANFWFEGRYIGAQVYAWIRIHGPVAKGIAIRHKCRNRHCVRIEHLEPGTLGDNNRDRLRDGTQRYVLTPDQVREAVRLRGLGYRWKQIAEILEVNVNTIFYAATHQRGHWRHVGEKAPTR